MTESGNQEHVEDVVITSDEEDFNYDRLVESDDESDNADEESLEILLRNVQSSTLNQKTKSTESFIEDRTEDLIENSDSFVRTFLTQKRLHNTLVVFQAEWYRLEATNSLDRSLIGKVPLMYLEYFDLFQKLQKLESEVNRMKETTTKVQNTWAKLKSQRDSYKRQHMRVVQEKHATINELKTLRRQAEQSIPKLDDINAKIESADKDRMLLEFEVQRLRQMRDRLLESKPKVEPQPAKEEKEEPPERVPVANIKSILPANEILNPYKDTVKPSLDKLTHRVVIKSSSSPISCVAAHPKKKIYATVGDDAVWNLWNAETKELLISGKGHTSWISSCSFHPRGAHLSTTSADGTVRIWDFLSSKCSLVLSNHTGVVWGADFHCGGRVIASCGQDSTLRIWDLQGGDEISILRGHDRDINCVKWMPYTNLLVTGGADHLVGLWDARSGMMANRGIGHKGTVYSVAPSLDGRLVVSADSKGAINVWDIRKMEPVFSTQYTSAIHSLAFDPTGSFIFGACDDGKAQVFLTDEAKSVWTLASFDQPCECISLNNDSDMVVCGAMDGNVAVCTTLVNK